jgi:DNA-binding NtrC family response regulator
MGLATAESMTTEWVLLIEDNEDFRQILKDSLELSHFEVVALSDGAQALALFDSGSKPSVVLSDMVLPGVLGPTILEYIAIHDELRDVTVGIITGSPDLAPEGYPVFTKPVNLREITEFVSSSMPSARAHAR